jgi:hypothetical protein
VLFNLNFGRLVAQQTDSNFVFKMYGDVTITINQTTNNSNKNAPTLLILFALPNGNSTAWTMGKKMETGDDWHFDIQHIRAQTLFIRNQFPDKNIVLAYLENDVKNWPAFRQKHSNVEQEVKHIVDTLESLFPKPLIYFNGHSGGGSLIFSYLRSVDIIPDNITRISFLDSDYNYDSSYTKKLMQWLSNKHHSLTVFAYNDSIALYNGKPVVSATGGTWYRSKWMLNDMRSKYKMKDSSNDSMIIIKSNDQRIQFFLKTNPDRKILHTKQVELNGFIHSILAGTKKDSKDYQYYGDRAYTEFIIH